MTSHIKMNIPKVESIMTKHVIYVSPEFSLEEVADTLVQNRIGSVPVILTQANKKLLLGFISEKVCLRVITNNLFYGFPKQMTAYSIMVKNPITISPQADLLELEQLFDRNNLRHVLVVDNDRLLGIVSRRDVLRTLTKIYDKIKKKSKEKRSGIKMTNPTELHDYMKHV